MRASELEVGLVNDQLATFGVIDLLFQGACAVGVVQTMFLAWRDASGRMPR